MFGYQAQDYLVAHGTSMQQCTRASANGTFTTLVNEDIIRQEFLGANSLEERVFLKRYFSYTIDYLHCRLPREGHPDNKLRQLLDLVESFRETTYCQPVYDERDERAAGSGHSLIDILHSLLDHKPFLFGPESQCPGEVDDDRRFICIFCHGVYTRTGDLRPHLRKFHKFSDEDINVVFHKDDPQGVNLFGVYSFEDVQMNNWNIKKWKSKKPKAISIPKTSPSDASTNKRKERDATPESDSQLSAPSSSSQPQIHKRPYTPSRPSHTETYTRSQGPSTTVPSNWSPPSTAATNLNLEDVFFGYSAKDEGATSMHSSCTSEDLVGIGNQPQFRPGSDYGLGDSSASLEPFSVLPFSYKVASIQADPLAQSTDSVKRIRRPVQPVFPLAKFYH